MTAEDVIRLLSRFRFRYTSEAELQAGIGQVLTQYGVAFEREVRLDGHSRVDFLVEKSIVIETKIHGSAPELMRQVSRYAEFPAVSSILVVTSRARHALPKSFNGKPVLIYSLIGGAL